MTQNTWERLILSVEIKSSSFPGVPVTMSTYANKIEKEKKLLQTVITGDDGYVRWNSAPLKLFRSNIHSGIRLFVEQKDTAYYTKNPPIFQGELLFFKKFGFEKVWLFAHMHLLKESRCELTPSFNCWTCVLTFSPPISSTSLKVINSLPHRSTARSRL